MCIITTLYVQRLMLTQSMHLKRTQRYTPAWQPCTVVIEPHQSLFNAITIHAVIMQVQKLMDMGFGKAAVIQALQDAHGDENAALELILSRS